MDAMDTVWASPRGLMSVSATMILSALAVIVINTPETMADFSSNLAAAYQVWSLDPENDGTGKTLEKSLANSLVMVSAIGAMTFGIVILYKYRCMKCLIGYMIFSSAFLLGLLGGMVASVGINKFRIPIDKGSFYFLVWNFAIVGVLAIFYQKGIPPYVAQAYLVLTSVLMAWQLSHFDEWTAWSLLVMLALYDLCAVLTPCGPLKFLVELMQRDDAPDMPGLLYEAALPADARRGGGRSNGGSGGNGSGDSNGQGSRSSSRSRSERRLCPRLQRMR